MDFCAPQGAELERREGLTGIELTKKGGGDEGFPKATAIPTILEGSREGPIMDFGVIELFVRWEKKNAGPPYSIPGTPPAPTRQ